ncbi:MAG TPA: methyltransferase domain-containing protein [Thermoguttaceae bacterium]|nr:methyltransferase domain-containing protein [Thermoguttaceae bacterium]
MKITLFGRAFLKTARDAFRKFFGAISERRPSRLAAKLHKELRSDFRAELRDVKKSLRGVERKLDILYADLHGMSFGERQIAPSLQFIQGDHVNRYRLACQSVRPADAVLDLGCGVGYGSTMLAEKAASGKVLALDVCPDAIRYAKRHYTMPNIEYLVADCLSIDLPDDQYDVVTCFELIEHLREAGPLLARASRWLKSEGTLVCSTPNEEVMPFDPSRFPYHCRHYASETFEALLREAGFRVERLFFQNRFVNFEFDDQGERCFLVAVCRRAAASAAAA